MADTEKDPPADEAEPQRQKFADVVAEILTKARKIVKRKKPPKRKTTYRTAIITFIDVLGFKSLVQTRSAAEIHQLMDRFTKELRPDDYELRRKLVHWFRFSDCLVRVAFVPPDEPNGPDGIVYWELYALVLAQLNLVWHGVVVRGAVSIGDVFCDRNTIFGPGLVKAYEMEKTAAHPRIIIDTAILDALAQPPYRRREHSFVEESTYVNELLGMDGDYPHLDYLKVHLSERDRVEDVFQFLEHHRDLITRGLQQHQNQLRVRAKYRWLQRQHNACVATLHNDIVLSSGRTKKALRA